PSASPALEAVLVRALATTAADRYQTATAFAAALQDAHVTGEVRVHPRRRRRAIVIGAAATLAVVGASAAGRTYLDYRGQISALDTTRVAVLPFVGPMIAGVRGENLLSDALREWQGLSLVENFTVSDAVRRAGGNLTNSDAIHLARELQA